MTDSSHPSRGFVFAGMRSTVSSSEKRGLRFLPGSPENAIRNHFIAMCGEFAGTFLFLFFAFTGTQVANSQTQGSQSTTIAQGSNPAQLLYISLCFGFSLAVNAWVFFRISGGLFNPAVTFGMVIVGAVPPIRGALVVVSQLVGSIAAAGIVAVLYPGQLNVRTSLGAGTSKAQGLFIEMFLTAELVFAIFMLAAEKHKGTFIAPIGIGLALFIAELGGVYYTGGSLNPARSFGPNVINHEFEDYHWIYWLGPLLGSLLASAFYKLIKALEYETANPGQDFDENETKLFDPERDVSGRPIVNLVASGSVSDQAGQSRPISGDTLGGYRREEIPMEPLKTSQSAGRKSPSRPLSGGIGGLGAAGATEAVKETQNNTAPPAAAAGVGHGEDIIHGGAHYTQTANRLDPRLHGGLCGHQTFISGPSAEAGGNVSRSVGRA
ncbi:Aquaporin-1 [Lecanora helva]